MATKQIQQTPSWYPLLFAVLAVLAGAAVGLVVSHVANPLYAIGGMAAVLLVVATVLQIEWGLLALVLISYANLSDVLVRNHNVPSILQPFIGLLIGALILRWTYYAERPKGWERAVLLTILYGLVAFASLFWASDAQATGTALVEFVKNGIIAILIVLILQRGATLRAIIWTLLASGILMGTVTVFQQLTHTFGNTYGGLALAPLENIVGEVSGYRISGPIGDPNFYGQILIVLVPLAVDRLVHERNLLLRLAAGWAFAVSLLSIVFTFSRGAFIGLVIVLAVMFLRKPPKLMSALVILAILVGALRFLPSDYTARLSTLSDAIPGLGNPLNEISIRGRLSENTVAWMMFMDHPILGVGLDNYPSLYLDYSRQLGIDPRLIQREPHNLYLEIASQLGLLGLTVFAILLYMLFRSMRQAYLIFKNANFKDYADLTGAFIVGVIGYLSSALFLHSAYERYFWVLFGIGMALPIVARNELLAREQRISEEQNPSHDGAEPVTLGAP